MGVSVPDPTAGSVSILTMVAVIALVLLASARLWVPEPLVRVLAAGSVSAPLDALDRVKTSGVWDAPGNIVFSQDVLVELPERRTVKVVDLSVDHNDMYRIEFLTNEGYLPVGDILPIAGSGIVRHRVTVPSLPFDMRTTQIRVSAIEGDGLYSLGHLVIE